MIVCPRNASAHGIELFVDDVHAQQFLVLLFEVVVAERQEPRRHHLSALLFVTRGGEKIAGDLLADEAVEGEIVVEGVDDVIAITPGFLQDEATKRQRFGVAGDVEPVPAPAFAELRHGEQLIDGVGHRLVEIFLGRLFEGVHLLRRRRQADEIEVKPAHQNASRSVRRGLDLLVFDSAKNEGVDIAIAPILVLDDGDGRLGHGAIRPEIAARLDRGRYDLARPAAASADRELLA